MLTPFFIFVLNYSFMKIINLGKNNSVFNNFISQIREVNIQQDSMRFRRNLERIGEIFAYEISKELDYKIKNINTLLDLLHNL